MSSVSNQTSRPTPVTPTAAPVRAQRLTLVPFASSVRAGVCPQATGAWHGRSGTAGEPRALAQIDPLGGVQSSGLPGYRRFVESGEPVGMPGGLNATAAQGVRVLAVEQTTVPTTTVPTTTVPTTTVPTTTVPTTTVPTITAPTTVRKDEHDPGPSVWSPPV